jgi:hypothetical protein
MRGFSAARQRFARVSCCVWIRVDWRSFVVASKPPQVGCCGLRSSSIFAFTASSILIRLRKSFGATSDFVFTVFLQTTRQFSFGRFRHANQRRSGAFESFTGNFLRRINAEFAAVRLSGETCVAATERGVAGSRATTCAHSTANNPRQPFVAYATKGCRNT